MAPVDDLHGTMEVLLNQAPDPLGDIGDEDDLLCFVHPLLSPRNIYPANRLCLLDGFVRKAGGLLEVLTIPEALSGGSPVVCQLPSLT